MTPPSPPPSSAGRLGKLVLAYATESGVADGRVRKWISFMVIGGALERAGKGDNHPFTIKGGVALELRLRTKARATKDLDLIVNHPEADLLRELDGALADGYEGFGFRRKAAVRDLGNGAIRVEIAVDYRGGTWGTIPVDLARFESGRTEVDLVEAMPLDQFGLAGPRQLPCLALRYHIAHKIHGMTRPSVAEWTNDRERDLIDLLLLEELVSDYEALNEACVEVFGVRGQHQWPPAGPLPPEWALPVITLAREYDIPVDDYDEATGRVLSFIRRIAAAGPMRAPPNPDNFGRALV